MADNYIEKKFEAYQARKAAAEKAKRLAWRKRMDAYRKKLAEEASATQVNLIALGLRSVQDLPTDAEINSA